MPLGKHIYSTTSGNDEANPVAALKINVANVEVLPVPIVANCQLSASCGKHDIHPISRADVRRRMGCPEEALAAPVVDIDIGLTSRNGIGWLQEVETKVLVERL